MDELKPCPFCGAIPIIQTKCLDKNKASTIIYRVIDENVDCRFFPSTGWYYLKQEAIEAWNRRIETLPVADVVEVVRCKDCDYVCPTLDGRLICRATTNPNWVSEEHFCSYGEKRSENGN